MPERGKYFTEIASNEEKQCTILVVPNLFNPNPAAACVHASLPGICHLTAFGLRLKGEVTRQKRDEGCAVINC